MAFVDLTSDYDYKPTYTPPNNVSPITPDISQQQTIWNTTMQGPDNPYPTDKYQNDGSNQDIIDRRGTVGNSGDGGSPPPIWDSTYQAWRDPNSGSLWDSQSGLWYSVADSQNPQVYRDNVGWQSVGQYNDYNKVLSEFGDFSQNPLAAQPSIFKPQPPADKLSSGEWQDVQQYMDRPQPSPQADFYNIDAQRDPNRGTFPTAYNYSLNNPTLDKIGSMDMGTQIDRSALRQTDPMGPGYQQDARFPTGGEMFGSGFDNSVTKPLSGMLGNAYGQYQKYIQNPIAETGAQLTPAALSLLKYEVPGASTAFGIGKALTGYNPDSHVAPGIEQLGSAVSNPSTFISTQNKNLAERPGWQQMAATTAYDPLNLLGAGLGAKALEGGALEGTGVLSKILRGAATVDKGIEGAQNAVIGGLLKPIGTSLKPVLGSEVGAIPAKLAARGAFATGAGAAGYLTAPEDATPEERWARALGFAGGAALGPEALKYGGDLFAKFGSEALKKVDLVPGIRKLTDDVGAGTKRWLLDAQEAKVLRDANLKPDIPLKEIIPTNDLPLRTKLSNTVWTAMGRADKTLIQNLDDPRVYRPIIANIEAEKQIPQVAREIAQTAGKDYLDNIALSPEGFQLGADGKPLALLDKKTGAPVIKTLEDGTEIPVFAGPRDVADRLSVYESANLVTPEQAAAIRSLGEPSVKIGELQSAFDIKPVGEKNAEVYISRGNSTIEAQADRNTFAREARVKGKTPTSLKERQWSSEGEAIQFGGRRYEHPVQATERMVSESYKHLNNTNLIKNLENTAIEGVVKGDGSTAKLADLLVAKNSQDAKTSAVQAVKDVKSEIKKLSTRQTRINRDIRLNQNWVKVQENRVQSLLPKIADQSLSSEARAEIAHDALTVSRQAINDSISAAKEYAAATVKAGITETDTRRNLNIVLDEAKTISDRMNKIEDAIRTAGNVEDALLNDAIPTTNSALGYADQVRKAMANDIAEMDARLTNISARTEIPSEKVFKAQEALGKAKQQFSDALSGMKASAKEAEKQAAIEAKNVANVRAAINSGRVKEIDRILAAKTNSLETMQFGSDELKAKITDLKDNLLPLEAKRDQIKADIKAAQDLGKQMTEKMPVGTIDVQGMEGVPVPQEIANAINKYKKIPENKRGFGAAVGGAGDMINDLFRVLGATADLSRTAVQGILNLFDDYHTSVKGWKAGIEAVKDPSSVYKIYKDIEKDGLADTGVTVAQAIGRGQLALTDAHVMLDQFAKNDAIFAKLFEKQPFALAEQMFTVPGNVERLNNFYDNLRIMKNKGLDITADRNIAAAANAANVMSGRASSAFLSPIVGDRNASRLWFAGRFIQAQLDTVMNAMLVSGIEGDVARRSLFRLVAGGAGLTYGINELLGEKTEWNPFQANGAPNPNWMRVRVAGHDVSLFGPWDTLAKGLLVAAKGDPMYMLRSKLSPGAGIAYDLSFGKFKDQFGNPIGMNWDTLDRYLPAPFGLHSIGKEALPPSLGGQTDWTDPKSVGKAAFGAVTTIAGFKSAPMSPREVYTQSMENDYQGFAPTNPDGKPIDYPKPKSVYDDPLFTALYDKEHPGASPTPTSKSGQSMEDIRKKYGDFLGNLNTAFQDGKVKTLGEWKDQRSKLKDEQRTELAPIVANTDFGSPEPGSPRDWLNKYYALFNEATDKSINKVDYDKLDQLQADFYASAPPWVPDYIDSFSLAGAPSKLEEDYRNAFIQLRKDGYFSGNDNSIPKYQGMVSGLSDKQIDDYRAIIDDWGQRPEYDFLKGKPTETKAVVILGDYWDKNGQPFDPTVVKDVGNSAKDKFQTIELKMYKLDHPELLAWLNKDISYDTLQTLTAK